MAGAQQEGSSWADLDHNILFVLFSQAGLHSHKHITRVCKPWRSALHKSVKQLTTKLQLTPSANQATCTRLVTACKYGIFQSLTRLTVQHPVHYERQFLIGVPIIREADLATGRELLKAIGSLQQLQHLHLLYLVAHQHSWRPLWQLGRLQKLVLDQAGLIVYAGEDLLDAELFGCLGGLKSLQYVDAQHTDSQRYGGKYGLISCYTIHWQEARVELMDPGTYFYCTQYQDLVQTWNRCFMEALLNLPTTQHVKVPQVMLHSYLQHLACQGNYSQTTARHYPKIRCCIDVSKGRKHGELLKLLNAVGWPRGIYLDGELQCCLSSHMLRSILGSQMQGAFALSQQSISAKLLEELVGLDVPFPALTRLKVSIEGGGSRHRDFTTSPKQMNLMFPALKVLEFPQLNIFEVTQPIAKMFFSLVAASSETLEDLSFKLKGSLFMPSESNSLAMSTIQKLWVEASKGLKKLRILRVGGLFGDLLYILSEWTGHLRSLKKLELQGQGLLVHDLFDLLEMPVLAPIELHQTSQQKLLSLQIHAAGQNRTSTLAYLGTTMRQSYPLCWEPAEACWGLSTYENPWGTWHVAEADKELLQAAACCSMAASSSSAATDSLLPEVPVTASPIVASLGSLQVLYIRCSNLQDVMTKLAILGQLSLRGLFLAGFQPAEPAQQLAFLAAWTKFRAPCLSSLQQLWVEEDGNQATMVRGVDLGEAANLLQEVKNLRILCMSCLFHMTMDADAVASICSLGSLARLGVLTKVSSQTLIKEMPFGVKPLEYGKSRSLHELWQYYVDYQVLQLLFQ